MRFKRVFLLILALCLLMSCSSIDRANPIGFAQPAAVSPDDSEWEDISGETVTISNDNIVFELDASSTHFTVKDVKSGASYFSVPEEKGPIISEELQNRLSSELTIMYSDGFSGLNYMYSSVDSVENESFSVKKNADSVRVYYTFGNDSSDLFVPEILTKELYDRVLSALTAGGERRMKLYYTFYSGDDADEDYNKMLKQYPALSANDLYILNDHVSSQNKIDIDGYMEAAEYTQEEYKKLAEEFNITSQKANKPGFTLPIEYTLNADGFKVSILTDKIKELSPAYPLCKIELLQFFAASDNNEKGYYVVPDGSGAIIEMNTSKTGAYSQNFFGTDYSKNITQQTMLTKDAPLPIFGISSESKGIFAVAKGAAMANLQVRTISDSNPMNTAWVTFDYRTVDTDVNEDMGTATEQGSMSGVYNLYNNAPLSQIPSVSFSLMETGASYPQMAAYYRKSLISGGDINSSAENADVLLDFYCMTVSDESFFGVPYKKKTVLSTLSQIETGLKELYKEGLKNVSVRLLGMGGGGIGHKINKNLDIDKKVGDLNQLKSIAALVRANGGQLYTEADFQFVYDTSGFDQRGDSAYLLNKKLVARGDFDLVTKEAADENKSFFVSPRLYTDISQSFLKSLAKAELLGSVGVSYSNIGSTLGGDYSGRVNINRLSAQKNVTKALEEAVKAGTGIIAGGGNAYVLPYASFLYDLPLDSSGYDVSRVGIPFYQMVVHGSIPYSQTAFNLSQDFSTSVLKSVESGAVIHYALMMEDDSVLRGSKLEARMFSLNYTKQKKRLVDTFKNLESYLSAKKNSVITNHEELLENVYKTTYENGTEITVNYSDGPVETDGKTIEAMSFSIG